MLADIALRHRDYAERELYDPRGRYGDVRWTAVVLLVVGTVLGWGLVTNTTTEILSWQGYLLGPVGLGGRDGAWAFANLGVLVALVVGFVGGLALDRDGCGRRRRERRSAAELRSCEAHRHSGARPSARAVAAPRRDRHAAGVRRRGQPVGHARTSRRSCRPWRASSTAFGDAVTFTRFVAPDRPAGAWRDVLRRSGRSRCSRPTRRCGTSCRSSGPPARPWTPRRSPSGVPRWPTGWATPRWCSAGSRRTAACSPRRSPRPTRGCRCAWSATPARASRRRATAPPSTCSRSTGRWCRS